MPAALRLLCGVVVPAALLCAEPLPRVTFASGEYGPGSGDSSGDSWDSWGGGHAAPYPGQWPSCPGLSVQRREPWGVPPS